MIEPLNDLIKLIFLTAACFGAKSQIYYSFSIGATGIQQVAIITLLNTAIALFVAFFWIPATPSEALYLSSIVCLASVTSALIVRAELLKDQRWNR